MTDFADLLGQIMPSELTRSGNDRLRHAMGDQGLGGAGGLLTDLLGGGRSSSLGGGGLGGLGELAGQIFGRGGTGSGGLGDLAGILLGGRSGGGRGALGGGLMALLGSLAMSALKNWNRAPQPSEASLMPLGLRSPENENEEQELQDNAQLILRAMINAAKADGHIGPAEIERITGKLEEMGADDDARGFILEEMGKPFDLNAITREVTSEELGAQVYAASLLSIEVDTPAEQAYMQNLAAELRLGSETVGRLHQLMGVA
jgi:uncharacterized membrane protein YebE (DUF533 family)